MFLSNALFTCAVMYSVRCCMIDRFQSYLSDIASPRIPFTIQRLCELLTEPKRNYTGTEKFLRGVEKVSMNQNDFDKQFRDA